MENKKLIYTSKKKIKEEPLINDEFWNAPFVLLHVKKIYKRIK